VGVARTEYVLAVSCLTKHAESFGNLGDGEGSENEVWRGG